MLRTLTPEEAKHAQKLITAIQYRWSMIGRASQQPPSGDWSTWLILSGRGWGKSRCAAEWVRLQVEAGRAGRVALVGATAADVRDVMVEGESGLLSVCPPWNTPRYEPSRRRVVWPNGAIAFLYSAEDPGRLRGPQHHFAACDEIATWAYPQEAWDNLQLGLRLGDHPRSVVTTTPRPIPIITALLAAPNTVVTRGSTYDNRANLAPSFMDQIVARYEGTRVGQQELYGELLLDVPGALWQRSMIRSRPVPEGVTLQRIVVAIDPAVTSGENSDETGMIVAARGSDGQGYILDDLSCRLSPDAWARRAVNAYSAHKADRIIAETNNGGQLVASVIKTVDPHVSYKAVHASRGKRVRAEPIAALYEQGKVCHSKSFPDLEQQMCNFTPDSYDTSPDRVDALVWALTELFLEGRTYRWA